MELNNKILILGSKGMLGGALLDIFGTQAVGWDREECDVTDFVNLKSKIQNLNPVTLINCVAYNDVDGAEDNKDLAFKLNTEVVKNLSELCKELDITLVHFSTNYVFDGKFGEYNELSTPDPASIYGESKYEGEKAIQKILSKYYIVRTSVLFGKNGKSELAKKSFVDLMLELSDRQNEIKVVNNEINSISYVNDVALAVKVLLSQQFAYGVYHFTNSGEASWYDFAKEIFNLTKKNIKLLPVSNIEFPRKAKRPAKAVLVNNKFISFRPWQEALEEYLNTNN